MFLSSSSKTWLLSHALTAPSVLMLLGEWKNVHTHWYQDSWNLDTLFYNCFSVVMFYDLKNTAFFFFPHHSLFISTKWFYSLHLLSIQFWIINNKLVIQYAKRDVALPGTYSLKVWIPSHKFSHSFSIYLLFLKQWCFGFEKASLRI